MSSSTDDDYEDYYIVTEQFCKAYDLPYNDLAANRAAISHDETFQTLRSKTFKDDDDIKTAIINLLIQRYNKELKRATN